MPQYTHMDAHTWYLHHAKGSEENVMKLVLSFHLYVVPGINPSLLSGSEGAPYCKCQIPVMVRTSKIRKEFAEPMCSFPL